MGYHWEGSLLYRLVVISVILHIQSSSFASATFALFATSPRCLLSASTILWYRRNQHFLHIVSDKRTPPSSSSNFRLDCTFRKSWIVLLAGIKVSFSKFPRRSYVDAHFDNSSSSLLANKQTAQWCRSWIINKGGSLKTWAYVLW